MAECDSLPGERAVADSLSPKPPAAKLLAPLRAGSGSTLRGARPFRDKRSRLVAYPAGRGARSSPMRALVDEAHRSARWGSAGKSNDGVMGARSACQWSYSRAGLPSARFWPAVEVDAPPYGHAARHGPPGANRLLFRWRKPMGFHELRYPSPAPPPGPRDLSLLLDLIHVDEALPPLGEREELLRTPRRATERDRGGRSCLRLMAAWQQPLSEATGLAGAETESQSLSSGRRASYWTRTRG